MVEPSKKLQVVRFSYCPSFRLSGISGLDFRAGLLDWNTGMA